MILLCGSQKEMKVFSLCKIAEIFFGNFCYRLFLIPIVSGKTIPVQLAGFPVLYH